MALITTTQMDIADQVMQILKSTPDVVMWIGWVEADQWKYEFIIDKEKAMLYGVTPEQIVQTDHEYGAVRKSSH